MEELLQSYLAPLEANDGLYVYHHHLFIIIVIIIIVTVIDIIICVSNSGTNCMGLQEICPGGYRAIMPNRMLTG